jgi:hypothetical protein
MKKATITANLVPEAGITDDKEIEKQIKDSTEHYNVLRRTENA